MNKIIGPFHQLLTMDTLPMKGPLKDEQLSIINNGAVRISHGKITEVGLFDSLVQKYKNVKIEECKTPMVAMPGFIDCHTHICFGGNRAMDYAARNSGKTYQEIAASGGGIWDTVRQTRALKQGDLENLLRKRLNTLLSRGITTVEVKSGYGLSVAEELKILRAIHNVSKTHKSSVISTCLAAHIVPSEFKNETAYLQSIVDDLAPIIKQEGLASRFDIFIEENAFSAPAALSFLNRIKEQGYHITVHGDQFSNGGSSVALQVGAVSVDHLESSTANEIDALSNSDTVAVVLPGASMGLGIAFAQARKLLDKGCCLAIASDWNPGSAPNGNLLYQAALIGAYEKLSSAEVLAGITYRAAQALRVSDKGVLAAGKVADMVAFECTDFREILYHQGALQPIKIWKSGDSVKISTT